MQKINYSSIGDKSSGIDPRGLVIRVDDYSEKWWLMNSTNPADKWESGGVFYNSLEELCEKNNLYLCGHYENTHGEYWRAKRSL